MKYHQRSIQLSQLVASRLNHDFVAPLTAISNGLELIKISPDMEAECLKLIEESVEEAIVQVQFYRLAFGAAGSSEAMRHDEFRDRLQNFAQSADARLELGGLPDELLRIDGKLVSLGLMCMRSSFSNISEVSLGCDEASWRIEMNGEGRLDTDGKLRAEDQWLDEVAPSSTLVHFPLFLAILEEEGIKMTRKTPTQSQMIVELKKA